MKRRRVIFLFPTNRTGLRRQVKRGLAPDNSLYGSNYLAGKYGVKEAVASRGLEKRLNRFLSPVTLWFNSRHTKLNLARVLMTLPRLNRADVVVTCVDSINRAVALFRRLGLLRTPIICTAGNVLDGSERWIGLHRWVWSGADVIITHAPVDQEKLVRMKLGQLGRMIPVGSDQEFYQPQRKGSDPKTVVAVGADRDRDYQTLLAAAQKLNQLKFQVFTRPGCVKGLKVPKNVSLYLGAGFWETRQAMKKAAVIVVPVKETNRASGQLALVDAMLLGKPVVASRVRGMVEAYGLRDRVSCFLVTPGNPQVLVGAIAEILENERGDEIARKGRELALGYTTRKYGKGLEKVIKAVLAKRS